MPATTELAKTSLRIEGMRCQGCVGSVQRALTAVPGVRDVTVDLDGKRAEVSAGGAVSHEALIQAVAAAGFQASELGASAASAAPGRQELSAPEANREPATELAISGMSCAACVHSVETALRSVPGVHLASVNFAARTASVEHDAASADLVRAVERAGYGAQLLAPDRAQDEDEEVRDLRRRLWVAVGASIPVAVLAMSHGRIAFPGSDWLQLTLTFVVLAYSGAPIFRSAWSALVHATSNMNTLVAVGTTAAFGFSAFVTAARALNPGGGWAERGLYFETAAVIVTLILLGRMLEAGARMRAGGAIRALANRQPQTAWVVREDGTVQVPASEIRVGDVIELRPGDNVAADGEVVSGASPIDESMLTGESVPVDKGRGDGVTGGTRNTTGSLRFRATAVGQTTVLAKIIGMVRRAQGSKAPIARLADRISAVFVPVVLAIAALTFGVWSWAGNSEAALVNAIAVLIIACPCALGLATPAALMVGIGRGAEAGILIRDAVALERLGSVDTVILDKTGTLTTGKLSVLEVAAAADLAQDDLLRAAAAVESASEHPLAQAIGAEAKRRGLEMPPAEGFSAKPGSGVEARWDGSLWKVGKPGDSTAPAELQRLRKAGATVVSVHREGEFMGLIALRDSLRPHAPEAAAALREMNIDTHVLSGDHERAVETLAAEAGIDRFTAGVRPEEKSEFVAGLQRHGRSVAMVGDGVNDGPALATAEVGIAIGGGTDVAMESAGVIVPGDRLLAVPEVIRLARRTLRTIRQNLFWAFAYNAVGIPVAAGLLYPFTGWQLSPILASAAMATSSVSVVLNSLRLRRISLGA